MNDRHHPNNPNCNAPDIQAWLEADEDRMRSVNDIINLWDELCVAFDTEHEGWEFINIEQLKDYANAKRTYRNPARTGQESERGGIFVRDQSSAPCSCPPESHGSIHGPLR